MPINHTIWNETGYKPFDKQVRFHASGARFKVPACGRRFGKSRMAAAEVEPYIFDVSKAGQGWVVALSYEGADEFQYLWEDIVMKMGWGRKIKKANNPRTGEMYMEFPWGHRVVVKSIKYMDSLAGKGLRWVILSESAKLPYIVWKKYITPALADYRAPAIMPSTPEGMNWYKTEAHDKGRDPNEPDWESWNFPAWENPYVYPGGFDDPEIQRQLTTPDDPFFWQEIGADFRSLVGIVYREFDPEVHVRQWTYRPGVINLMWFDFGFTNPFVALDVQITPSDDVYIWREYYKPGLPPHMHAKALKERQNPEGYRIDIGSGDAADASAVETLGRMLCPMVAENDAKDVMTGIRQVKQFLSPNARIFVDPSCKMTIEEFENYRMREAKHRNLDEDPKEEPVKTRDHCMDAIRYGIMHYFYLGLRPNTLADFYDEDALAAKGDSFFTRGENESFSLNSGVM